MLIEKRNFLKGQNGDLFSRLLTDGESLNLMNCRMSVSEQGRYGRLESIPGTTLVSQSVYPPYGTAQTLGSGIDYQRGRILYANYNSHGDNAIYCWDYHNDIVYAVLYDSQVTGGLGFSKTSRINRNMEVVGDMLYWTDDLNSPRRINIEAGIKMNHASYSTTVTPYSWPMNQSVINLIRRPYGLPVVATKINSGGLGVNFISEFAGQFACILVYRDGEESVVSVPSAMTNFNISTDTYNDVQITFPLAETFDQDVQKIQLLVRYENTPDYFIIKEWNKSNATDLAEIIAHNNGITNLTYNFYNNETGVAIGEAKSVKDSDSIGLTVKTLRYAQQRLFLGNYTKGYNTPTTTSLTGSISVNPSDPASATSLKSYSSWQIGVVFKDNSKRRSSVVTNAACIVTSSDRSFSSVPYSSIAWALSNSGALNEIPDWAYYYDIVITKNLRTRYFLQSAAMAIHYVRKNTDGTFSYQTNYASDVYGISVNIGFLLSIQNIGYVADKDDVCRLYLGNTSTVYEMRVIDQDGGQNIIIAAKNIGNLNPQPGAFFEIYTPYLPSDNETFYTTGQTYKITNPGTSLRVYSTVGGVIDGDITRINTSVVLTPGYEKMSPSLVNPGKWLQFYGESNFQLQLGQVDKKDFFSWSNPIILGTQVNGLSSFEPLNEKQLPSPSGELTQLMLANKVTDMGQGNIMLAICENETISLYLGESQLMAAAKQGDVATISDVVGSMNVLVGSRGTTLQETVINIYGLVFFYDILNGVFVQYSVNGLEDVSRYNMSRFFKKYASDYLAASANNLDNINGFHHIPTAVDPFNKEILCTLPALIYENYADVLPSYSGVVPSYATSIINRFDIYDRLGKTMAFSFEENKWGSNYSFMGEWYEYLDNQMVGFKNGLPYKFNSDTTNYNNFFGTTYPIRICLTGNLNSSLLKVLNNIAIEGSVAPDYTVALTATPNQQITDLVSSDYTNQEGVFYSYFFMDRIDPNGTGTADQKLYNGSPLTDFSIFVMLEFSTFTGLQWVQFVNVGYSASRGQKQILNIVNS